MDDNESARSRADTIIFGGYKWRILTRTQGSSLIITDGIIEKRAYNTDTTYVTWETCSLRAYLNGEFYNQFTNEQKERIAKATIINSDNEYLARGGKTRTTHGGNSTNDFIFVLSISEAKRFFHASDITGEETGYWDEDKMKKIPSWGPLWYARSKELEAEYAGKAWRWWLRSPGFVGNHASYVYDDGTINAYGYNVRNSYVGIRPALYLLD